MGELVSILALRQVYQRYLDNQCDTMKREYPCVCGDAQIARCAWHRDDGLFFVKFECCGCHRFMHLTTSYEVVPELLFAEA